MNQERRRRIRNVVQTIQQCADEVAMIRDEEEDAMSNLPENLQDSDRYTAMEDAASYLDEAGAALEDAVQSLESSMS